MRKIKIILALLWAYALTMSAQDIQYLPLHDDAAINGKTVNTALPVGFTAGALNVSPTGGASYTIPIALPPGTKGVVPSLSIGYNSQGGNGIMGMGWNIAGLSAITRTGKNIHYDGQVSPVKLGSEDYFALDGNRLESVSGNVYNTKMETFSKITTNGTNPDWFKVETKSGMTYEYGNTADSKLKDDNGVITISWQINKMYDQYGNYIEYIYEMNVREIRIKEINYTGKFNTATGNVTLVPYNKISFTYKDRTADKNAQYIAGSEVALNSLLTEIVIYTEGSLQVKKYTFEYGVDIDNMRSFLNSVKEYGSDNSVLNATILKYNNAVISIQSANSIKFVGDIIGTGDFNGDGLKDILTATHAFDANRNAEFIDQIKVNLSIPGTGLFFPSFTKSIVGTRYFDSENRPLVLDNKNVFVQDFNGDGRDDICVITETAISAGSVNFASYSILQANETATNFVEGTLNSDALSGKLELAISAPASCFDQIFPGKNYFRVGDFDGDGRTDFIAILKGCNPPFGTAKAFLFTPATDRADGQRVFTIYIPEGASSWLEANKFTIGDFDGDSKSDVMITPKAGTKISTISHKIYRIIPAGLDEFSRPSYYAEEIYTKTLLPKAEIDFKIGDFNGDGKSDVLGFNAASNSWYLYTAKGNNIQRIAANLPFVTTFSKFDIGDFNGDGLSDVVVAVSIGNLQFDYKIYYSTGKSFVLKTFAGGKSLFTLGDFNGDGKTDIYTRQTLTSASSEAVVLSLNPLTKDGTLDKIADGFNQISQIEYKYLTEGTLPYTSIYTKNEASSYPFNVLKAPIKVVSQILTPNGVNIGSSNVTRYAYENLKVHRRGLGLLGFKKFITDGYLDFPNQGTRSITEFEILASMTTPQYPIPHYATAVKEQTVSHISNLSSLNNKPLSKTTNLNSIRTNGSRYWQTVNGTTSINNVTGATSTSTRLYDDYGNVTYEESNINNEETIVKNQSFSGIYGTTVPAHPESVSVFKTRLGTGVLFAANGNGFVYNSKGEVISKTDDAFEYGKPLIAVGSTTYEYYPTGMLKKSTLSSTGLPSKAVSYEYDAKNRFVTATINPLLQREEKTYDPRWGTPLTEKDINGLVTTYTYDAFGRVTNTLTPQGHNVQKQYLWSYNAQYLPIKCYDIITSIPGKPSTWDIYDVMGRKTVATHQGYGDADHRWVYVYAVTEYDTKGNVANKTTPVNGTDWAEREYTYFQYDYLNRLTGESNPTLGATTYAHTNNGAGQSTITVTTPAGQVSSKTTDASGKVISTTDHGGTLTFDYDNRGNQTAVKMDGTVITSMTYDVKGHQKTLTDQNSGTTQYNYNNYGELIWQKDARNSEYTMDYNDPLGRLKSRTGPEGTTTNEYVTSGNGLNMIKKITGFSGILQEYTYDNWHRLATTKETIDGMAYTKTFTYNVYNDLETTIYPSGLVIKNSYSTEGFGTNAKQDGYLTKVVAMNDNKDLFDGTSGDLSGSMKWRNYKLGNTATSNITYNRFSMPTLYRAGTDLATTNKQYLELLWNLQTGNLTRRLDANRGLEENFSYDNLNRLRTAEIDGLNSYSFDFNDNGNTFFKSDVGSYAYSTSKPNAVEDIYGNGNGTGGLTIPLAQQDILYTKFQRPEKITEGGYELSFTYASDYERRKTVLKQNGNVISTRLFMGDYEIDTKGGTTRYIHYISGGDGLCAIVVKDGINGAFQYFFPYTDHLGSILTVTDANGDIVAEQNFDAWGRKRNVSTGEYDNVGAVPAWLYRGFTGHEHLPEFGLINMNARLYDHVLGRMLSADNYVGAGTQGLNRYSYANNNPLNHVDPDGNFAFEIAKFAGHAIATGVGVTFNAMGGKYNHSGGGLQALGDIGIGLANGVLAAVNPLDVSFGFGSAGIGFRLQSGTDGVGLGIEAGVGLGIGNHRFVEAYAGVSIYSSSIGTNRPSIEGYAGIGIGYKYITNAAEPWSNEGGYSDEITFGAMIRSTVFFSGKTSQRLGSLSITFPFVGKQGSLTYENDYFFNLPNGDGGDRFRTTGARLQLGDFSMGMNLFTGDPGLNSEDRITSGGGAGGFKGTYEERFSPQHRAGIFYLGYKDLRIGGNGEPIRNFFQNKLAHGNGYGYPLFRVLNTPSSIFLNYQTSSRYTTW
jgi:RHS repeat-associated protein